MRTSTITPRERGVSLIEALVALAVMAFGILGVVGVQLTLRNNADIAKQRAQAVRIAQEAIEDWRGFTTLTLPLPTGHALAFEAIASAATTTVPTASAGVANTTYTITRWVEETTEPRGKAVRIQVAWTDRTGATQDVELSTRISGILPELSGAVSLPGRSLNNQQLGGRHGGVPVDAVDQGDGTSNFAPPGAPSGVTWVFSNTTGVITSICVALPAPATSTTCTAQNATLLAGFVRFALGGSTPTVAPTGANAEFPTDLVPTALISTLDLEVRTGPPSVTHPCYVSAVATSTYMRYACAVELPAPPATSWTGTSFLTGLPLASSIAAGASNTDYRVCRYTPATSASAAVPNIDHPFEYTNVSSSLQNQNFLVIRAGDGTTAFTCPGDGSSPLVNGNTLPHQPNT